MGKTDSRTLKRKMAEEEGRALSLETVQDSEGGTKGLFSDVPVMAWTQLRCVGRKDDAFLCPGREGMPLSWVA